MKYRLLSSCVAVALGAWALSGCVVRGRGGVGGRGGGARLRTEGAGDEERQEENAHREIPGRRDDRHATHRSLYDYG